MPRHPLTPADRRKAADSTNQITRDRKAKRQAKVQQLLAQRKRKSEIARLLGVRPETISRDCREMQIASIKD